jgi:branched-chain amino acid transport system ATP-binding protein
MHLLHCEDLVVAYGGVEAVKGIGFSVSEGQIVVLVGANGAGKTTTLAAISGLVHPRRGRIVWRGQDIAGLQPYEIVRRGIVQVPEGRAIIARMSVLENLELGAYTRSDRAAVRAEMSGLLDRFPILRQRLHLPAGTLSGGEQQMLAIARGLLARPSLLLLDEPSLGLAPQLVRDVFRIIAEIRARGTTILLVEQNARKALALADHGYVLENGRVALQGSGAALLADQAVVRAYLGAV